MSELQALLSQKESLAEQLRRIAETCEGLENETNAAKVATLNEEQLKLTAQKNELQDKVASLEKQLLEVSRKINELSGSGVERILNAIKNQRWFFFKNKPKVLMDRDTALLWANLDYFKWRKSDNNDWYSVGEIQGFINSTNSSGIDGYKGWNIPTNFEFWKMIEDKTFPFKSGSDWYINDCRYWFVYYNGNIKSKFLDYNGTTSGIFDSNTSFVLPCSHAIAPKDYEQNISPANKVYSEKEKLLMTLNVFVTNGLEPIFNDAAITELFRQIYIVKPEVQRQLTEIQQQIERLNEVELISPKLDWLALKTKFDMGATSPVRYAESLKNLTEHLLDKFDDYTAEKSSALDALIKLSPPNELVPNVRAVRADLESFHEDALILKESLMKTSGIMRLTETLADTQPPFDTVTEILTEKIRQVLLKVEFFELQPEFVRKACAAVNLKYEFRSEYLKQFHIVDRVAQKVIANLVRYVKAGHLQKKVSENLTAAELALAHLQNYREAVADVYKNSPNDNPPKEEITLRVETLQKNFAEVVSTLDDEKERHHLKNLLTPLENLN